MRGKTATWTRSGAALVGVVIAFVASSAHASTGTCDVSPGEYSAYTGADPISDPSPPASTTGLSEARCMKTIRTLGGFVVEDVFKDGKGRFADALPSYGKLFDMYPGENENTICNGHYDKGQRNVPSVQCDVPPHTTTSWTKNFGEVATYLDALDWKYANSVRYDPSARSWCSDPSQGCFGGQCYDASNINPDGTLKAGATPAGGSCTTLDPQGHAISDGDTRFYNPWDALVFDMGGLANKVAIFAVNDHGPQPCESNEYTVYLTNNPYSRAIIDDPGKTGADPDKWNRAKLYKIFTHGWIDDPDCCDSPSTCSASTCTLPAPGDPPKLEADSMTLVFSLPCGIAFRYAAFIAGYDGHSLTDPSAPADACAYHSFDAEVDAVAGLNDDESAICPDKDHDGFPTCDCTPAPVPCDCVDDPAKDPDAPKYHPGAPQACDGPQYSCAPTPCPAGTYCFDHQCLDKCAPGEFKCSIGFTCTPTTGVDAGPDAGGSPELCVPAPCGDAGVCPPGDVCESGKCVNPCDPPTKCPFGQICQDGKCKDPCALIKCPAGQTCQGGLCHDNCACLDKSSAGYPCKGATPSCDGKTGGCVPAGCDTTTCPTGDHCESATAGPTCLGPCDGVVCPKGSTCDPVKGCATPCDLRKTPCPTGTVCHESDGTCVEPGCEKVDCPSGFVCKSGTCTPQEPDGGCLLCDTGASDGGRTDASSDASFDDGGPDALGDNPASSQDGGCGCSMPGGGAATSAFAATLALFAAVAARRRKR